MLQKQGELLPGESADTFVDLHTVYATKEQIQEAYERKGCVYVEESNHDAIKRYLEAGLLKAQNIMNIRTMVKAAGSTDTHKICSIVACFYNDDLKVIILFRFIFVFIFGLFSWF